MKLCSLMAVAEVPERYRSTAIRTDDGVVEIFPRTMEATIMADGQCEYVTVAGHRKTKTGAPAKPVTSLRFDPATDVFMPAFLRQFTMDLLVMSMNASQA